mgnify:CR=1 FL=1
MARRARGRVRNTSSGGSWGRRGGKEALEQARQERKVAANRRNYGPQEFGLRNKGDVREIVFLDDNLDSMFYVHRHDWYQENAKPPVQKFLCARQIEECPICAEYERNPKGPFGPSAFTIMSSIIEFVDPEEDDPLYTTKKDEDVFHAKRLFAMKATQSEEYERIFQIVEEKHGTLRGLVLLVQRGEGKQSPRIGKPTMLDDGQMYYMMSEDELAEEFGHDAIKGDDGKVLRPADDDIHPYDYGKLFPEPNAEDLAEQANVPLVPGSEAENRRARGREDEDEGDDEPRSRRGRGSRRRGRSEPADDEPPARQSRGRRSRSRSRSADQETEHEGRDDQDDEQGDDREEDQPRTRTRTRSRARPPEDKDSAPPRSRTRRGRGRAASADDTDSIPM